MNAQYPFQFGMQIQYLPVETETAPESPLKPVQKGSLYYYKPKMSLANRLFPESQAHPQSSEESSEMSDVSEVLSESTQQRVDELQHLIAEEVRNIAF